MFALNNKDIFIKNKNENIQMDKNLRDELSDELNELIGNKSNTIIHNNKSTIIVNKSNIPTDNKFDKFDKSNNKINIDNIFNDLSDTLSKNKSNDTITGEIIKFQISDINAYINIKVQNYQISGIFWKILTNPKINEYKRFIPGDQIEFEGSFNIMKKNLSIYFNIKSMNKIGLGDYLSLHNQYRIKINELNMNINKKIIIKFPFTIGIITALEGAAIQDILQTFKLDKFIGKIIIKNTIVQGKQCPSSLINSIEYFENNYSNSLDSLDILLVTRGGGSYEDLVGFSDWNLLVKIFNTKFITISAVGHQIDNQLSDDVADYKFATPSIAAKFIVETQHQYIKKYIDIKVQIKEIIKKYNESKIIFNNITYNFNKIIKSFDQIQIKNVILKYSNSIKNILNNYSNAKQQFYSKLTNLKPTIIKNNEITSINDFIDPITNKEINPKKIEIYFADGKIKLYYKIIDYELYGK